MTTHVHVLEIVEVGVLLDDLLGLLADELCEGVDGALAAVLPLGHDAVAHVLQGRVLGDVEPRAQTDARKNNKIMNDKIGGPSVQQKALNFSH